MLNVKLVKVQLASELIKGMTENNVFNNTMINNVVNHAPVYNIKCIYLYPYMYILILLSFFSLLFFASFSSRK